MRNSAIDAVFPSSRRLSNREFARGYERHYNHRAVIKAVTKVSRAAGMR